LEAIRTLGSADAAARVVAAMRARVAADDYSGSGFARRHVAMSLDLLRKR
jgi:hypothetical protein